MTMLWHAGFATGIVCAFVLIATAIMRSSQLPEGANQVGGPFRLTSDSGVAVTERTYRGKWQLIYFGYTFCPDACPTTLSAIASALDKLGPDADRVQPLFITIDPARDTPAVLHDYLGNFDRRIVGLFGDQPTLNGVEHEFGVYAAKSPGNGPGDYTLDHTSVLYLFDPDGRFVTGLPGGGTGPALAQALRPYLDKNL